MSNLDIDIDKLRKETAGCERVLHFNNAGSSLIPDAVYQSVLDHLALERQIGGYEAEAEAKLLLDSFYSGFAKLLNANINEIAYVENATRAWDMAFYAIPLKEGDRVLTHESEYASNYLAFLQLAKRRGIEIDLVPSDSSGQIDVEKIPELISSKTKVIAITHVPTQGGLVNPAAAVGKIAKDNGLIFLLDACQSVGQLNIDVAEIQCDVLSGTGRKFLRGPRGTGFLYVSNSVLSQLEPPFIDLHSAKWTSEQTFELANSARRFENFESYIAGRIGLATAVQYALDIGMPKIEHRVKVLAERLRATLSQLEHVNVQDQGVDKCGIVTFTKKNENASQLAHRLKAENINISVSLREYAQLDFGARDIDSAARASVHYFNTESEIDRFCQCVETR